MTYYSVWVDDRQTHDTVCVGAMLTIEEVRRLMSCLNAFNAADTITVRYEKEVL